MILAGFALIERSLKSISLSSTLAIVYLAFAATMLAGSLHSLGQCCRRFSSKIYAEGVVLGHLIAKALERGGCWRPSGSCWAVLVSCVPC